MLVVFVSAVLQEESETRF